MSETTRPWWVLVAASAVLGLVVLDETVVGVALPTMSADLAMSQVESHWVVNAYLLTFTCFLAVGGKLGDMLGRRVVFPVGAGIFLLGSLLAGLAPSGGWLIAARAVQGIGAAVTFPASMAIVTHTFPPERRGMAFAVQTTLAGCFMASGPLVGGVFAQTISWRWIFLINLPIVLLTVGALWLAYVEKPVTRAPGLFARFDRAGLALLVGALTAITIGLMQATEWGWSSPAILTLLAGGLVLLAAFVGVELKRAAPLIELDLLAISTFTGGNIVFAVFQFEKTIVFIFVALYLQHVLGRTPIESGLLVSIAIVPTLLTSRLAGRIRDARGARGPLTLALLLTALCVMAIGIGTVLRSELLIGAVMVVWGAVMPGIAVTARPALMGAVALDKQGQASGVNLSIQMLGGTVAIAVCGTLLVATGAYWLVFLITGLCTLAAAGAAWLLVERPG
ncbi:MFS transporter [Ancylobacter mangrovi]|uniref:MFS transporter n=1 Tax=Ancylobacter mangrovi TaxID=2972472 RepID=UPI0021620F54|nr:MFS transporter [Ancylobacter mangrovi]MCS0503320.1 MFS transporter [Ancylobacter mangrovi]